MQSIKLFWIVKAALVLGVLWCPVPAQANPPPPVESAPALDVLPGLENFVLSKSEFVDNLRFGKDPFFPKSERRRAAKHVATNVEPDVVVGDLSLKGISGQRGRRLAIINNRTFAIGETIEMRVSDQTVKVQCIEIKDRTVVITINGQRKELSLGQH